MPRAATALTMAAFAASLATFWGCFADDAYIVARYAANFVHGNGLVYNAGERISALTSPLQVFVLAPLEAIAGRSIQAYAVLAAIATAVAFAWCAPRVFADETRRGWFLLLGLLFPPLAFWAIGGLETPLLTLFALGLLAAWRSAHRAPRSAPLIVLVFAALAILTRYDAVLLVAPAALFVLHAGRRDARVWATAAACALAGSAWFAFSFGYFGDILPTSFYLKDPTTFGPRDLVTGLVYEASLLAILLSPLALAFLLGGRSAAPSADASAFPRWPIVAGLVLYFLYGLTAGTKHMMYLYRLFVPCVPWIAFLVVERLPSFPAQRGFVAALLLQLAWVASIHFESLNLNITVPFAKPDAMRSGMFEFDHLGARSIAAINRVFASHADALRKDWVSRPHPRGEAPRIFAITAGQPPYDLRDWYVYEYLSGYRKNCRYDLTRSADYRQYITVVNADGTLSEPAPASPWQLAASTDLDLEGMGGGAGKLRVSWYYQPSPEPHRLPPTLGAPCAADR